MRTKGPEVDDGGKGQLVRAEGEGKEKDFEG